MPVLVLLSVVRVGMQQWNRNQNEMPNLGKVKNERKYAANNKQFQATFPWHLVKQIPDSCQTPWRF